jgi:very-short-patch-repair endonuclease
MGRAIGSNVDSALEAAFYQQVKDAGLPEPILQFIPVPGRKYRCDFAWPQDEYRLILELEGSIYVARSGHRSASGVVRDIEKYNLLTLNGWCVLRATTAMVMSGEALDMVRQVLGEGKS